VLCLDCHSLVTGDEGLGRRYAPGELILRKKDWEEHCIRNESGEDQDDESEDDEPIESHYEWL
jgi:hypothetical protein